MSAPGTAFGAVAWQDVELAAYDADLPVWEELAASTVDPILELGCGNGRVGLQLARRGRGVVGVDLDPAHVEEFNRRAKAAGVGARAVAADARDFLIGREFGLIIAPLQFIQLLYPSQRQSVLASIAAHLKPDGRVALAIVEGMTPARLHRARLWPISAGEIRSLGAAAGLEPAGVRAIPPSPLGAGSTVVVFRRSA
jgi:2-polyprenyl-3-methyl-5-hydroxy-6-metoxy-1,4-benzoquinol methylase